LEEQRRRAYLAAMGIPLWLPRNAPDPAPDPVPDPAPAVAASLPESPPEPPAALPEPPPATPPRPPPAAAAAAPTPDPVASLDWDALQARVADCRACPELVRSRARTVFGVGDRQARLMVIGEAPGVDEDRQGEPFVGRAGQLLTLMLRAMGLTREQVFIANICKCHPQGNRDPAPDEAARCAPFLQRQIALVAPRVILAVGRIAAQNLLHTDRKIGELRGRVHGLGEARTPLVVTYHPAYLLRQPAQKEAAWTDLQLALHTLQQAG
jgi:uracil-DNA glycosylase family 4